MCSRNFTLAQIFAHAGFTNFFLKMSRITSSERICNFYLDISDNQENFCNKIYCIFYIYIRKFNAFSSAKPSWFSEIHAFSPKNMHFSPKNMQFSPKNMQFFLKYMHFSIYVLKRLNRGRWYTFWIGWRHLAAIEI